LRAITGSADGKIRIWNVLNGDCIRVMRGNSRCDPILSMSIIDNRILMNTEHNIILMEFEPVLYEYGSNREETSESTAISSEERQMYKNPQKQFYSTKRACRMELLQTPNTKLFNNRKTPNTNTMSHSSNPISNKNLKEAHLIHTILSTKDNNQLIVNCAGHISETALNKRRSVMQSINAVISSHCSSSLSSFGSYKPNINESNSSLNNISTMDIHEKENNQKIAVETDTNNKQLPTNLIETKQFLRDQLKEIKQTNQKQEDVNFSKITAIKEEDTKSCIDHVIQNKKTDDHLNITTGLSNNSLRVLSARPTFDTKTKIKLKSQDIANLKLTNVLNKATSLDNLNVQKFEQHEKNNKQTNNTQTIVSKVFETQETDLKSKDMYPMRVNSKIPNPKIIRPQTVPSKLITDNFVPNYINNTTTNSLPVTNINPVDDDDNAFETNKPLNQRSKSAAASKPPLNNTNSSQRPRTGKSLKTNNTSSLLVTEPLVFDVTKDHLHLKTYKEIDKIADVISGHLVESDKSIKEKFQEKDDVYKKFWLLKSTGNYHGSLLAKPKITAPEIRE
jgi:hypothetical protein